MASEKAAALASKAAASAPEPARAAPVAVGEEAVLEPKAAGSVLANADPVGGVGDKTATLNSVRERVPVALAGSTSRIQASAGLSEADLLAKQHRLEAARAAGAAKKASVEQHQESAVVKTAADDQAAEKRLKAVILKNAMVARAQLQQEKAATSRVVATPYSPEPKERMATPSDPISPEAQAHIDAAIDASIASAVQAPTEGASRIPITLLGAGSKEVENEVDQDAGMSWEHWAQEQSGEEQEEEMEEEDEDQKKLAALWRKAQQEREETELEEQKELEGNFEDQDEDELEGQEQDEDELEGQEILQLDQEEEE